VRLLHATARVRRMPTTCHHASFIDTLPSTNQRFSGLRSVASLRLASIQSRPVATSGIQSRPVATSGNKWHPVTSSGNKWHSCGVRWQQWQQVAVRSHFGFRLEGRIRRPRRLDRASTVPQVPYVPSTEYILQVPYSVLGTYCTCTVPVPSTEVFDS
jgi:hypothetical protein